MKQLICTIMVLLPLWLSAETTTWEASEAFADKGLQLPYTSIDGLEWTLADGITVSFAQAEGTEYPDNSTRPAAAWLYPGNELRIQAPEGIILTQVELHTLADFDFLAEAIALSSGSTTVMTNKTVWMGETGRLAIGPANAFNSMHSPGARAAITDIVITYLAPQSGIHELRLPHARARLTIRHRHLHLRR